MERIEAILDRITAKGPRPGSQRRYEKTTHMLRRRHADAVFFANEGLSWRGGAVLAWSGMRGVVTLAAAQSLPTDVPHRAELVLIAFTVAIVTLVVQGGTLPVLIKLVGIQGTDADRERSVAIAEVIDKRLTEPAADGPLQERLELQRLMVDAQQNALLDARTDGTYSSHTLERAQRIIDAQATRFGDA